MEMSDEARLAFCLSGFKRMAVNHINESLLKDNNAPNCPNIILLQAGNEVVVVVVAVSRAPS
jgi:hypothetical protein